MAKSSTRFRSPKSLPGSFPWSQMESGAVTITIVDAEGNSHKLDLPVAYSFCAGNIGVTTIPLLPGATYSVPLELVKYQFIVPSSGKFEHAWAVSGSYGLEAQVEAEIYTNPKSRFLVTTNRLKVELPTFPTELKPRADAQ